MRSSDEQASLPAGGAHPEVLLEPQRAKLARLRELVAETKGVMVAFSGGADSALLLAVAAQELGPRAVGATGVSPSLAPEELAGAKAFAQQRGIRHVIVVTNEGERPEYVRNGRDRCYFCKDELFTTLAPLAAAEGLALAVGTNTDDLGDWRPGQRAAAQRGVLTPLVEAGLSKAEVRAVSRSLGLETWDKPAAPCLASRVAYGLQVTPARLSRVEQAERLLRSLGFGPELRVRDHGSIARLELPPEAVPRAAEPHVRRAVVQGLRQLGYTYVTLDLDGLRPGSLNLAPIAARAPHEEADASG